MKAVVKYVDQTDRAAKAMRRAFYRKVEKTAFAIRKSAVDSIERAQVAPSQDGKKRSRKRAKLIPSPAGMPPRTRFGQIKRAIVYAAAKGEAVIGPRHSIIGESGSAHEFGGKYQQEDFPARPFMGPALDKNLTLFGNSFAGAIGG